MSRSVKPDYEARRADQARSQEADRIGDDCPECRVRGDHTWWCSIAPQILPSGKRPYYWRG